MSNKKIRELSTGNITNNNDFVPVATNGGQTVKVPYSSLISVILQSSLVPGSNITITNVTEQDGLARYRIDSSSGTTWYYGDIAPEDAEPGDFWIDTSNDGNLFLKGADGITPHIDPVTKHWVIGDTDTGVVAEGRNGTNGTNGITPHINSATKHWFIGETDTNVVAEGQDGDDGSAATISVGTVTTGASGTNATVTNSGTSSAAVFDFMIPRGADGTNGTNGTNGYSISATTTSITGGHSITVSSTDPNVNDTTFNVMDGTEIIQTTSDNRTATLSAASWVGASAPYTQTITVLGMTSSVVPIIGVVPSNTLEDAIEEVKQWGYINKAESATDTITFTCYSTKPTIDLVANIKIV